MAEENENPEESSDPEANDAFSSTETDLMLEDTSLEAFSDLDDPIALIERIYQIWWHWADFHLYVISPFISSFVPPILLPPGENEFVYPIQDAGSRLSTSKALTMFESGMSMCKLYFTIEKMIELLIERLKAEGTTRESEVQVAFGGHELAQRKAFEVVINLPYNVVITNFDPGVWGERYLDNAKRVAQKGYGYPSEAPRDTYKQGRGQSSTDIRGAKR